MRHIPFLLGISFVFIHCSVLYEGDEPGECSDQADNDRDGDFDCNDSDCMGSSECTDGTDADTDTDTDSDTDSDTDTDGPDTSFLVIGSVPQSLSVFSCCFTKHVSVFGVHVFATENTPDEKVLHTANVLAQYLDNDEDGDVDNTEVGDTLVQHNAFMFLTASEGELDSLNLDSIFDGGYEAGQFQHAQETNPGGQQFDATLEEVLHLITMSYIMVYPDVFGFESSTLTDAMDLARGGHFEEDNFYECEVEEPQTQWWADGQCAIPPNGDYPEDAWYTYLDPTCDYGCMMVEYFYWGLTAILGAQEASWRCSQISDEWPLCTPEQVESGDPLVYSLLTNDKYQLPTVLPDGSYGNIDTP